MVDDDHERFVADAQGRFGPVPVRDRDVRFRFWGPEHVEREEVLTFPAKPPDPEPLLTLAAGAVIEGHVVDADGNPVVGALVSREKDEDGMRVFTGPEGGFRWPVVSGEFLVEAGRTTELVYDFPRYGRVRGRVTDPSGRPVGGATVRAAVTGIACDIARSDGDGAFHLVPLPRLLWPAGPTPLWILHPDFAPTLTRPVDLRRTSTVEVSLRPGGRISGLLVNRRGQRLSGTISWLPEIGPPLFRAPIYRDGTFSLTRPLPAGRISLLVLTPGREPIVQPVTVVAGEETAVRIVVR